MKNADSDNILGIRSEILSLRRHITFVEYAILYLRSRYDREMIDKLISIGYSGTYPEDDKEAYEKQLDLVVSLCKAHIYKLWELVDEDNRIEKDKMGGKSTEEDFVKNIAKLSKYQGYNIDPEQTTVFKYAMIHNNYLEEMKAYSKSNKGPDS